MRLVFMGTPEFAVPSLEALLGRGHEVAAVFTQPDRPKGRGQQVTAPPVKQCALAHGLVVYQPERIRQQEVREQLASLAPRVIVVVGYGQILPADMLDLPPLGFLNVHASLLPKYRGAAPIQWAIASGEQRTGVTIMRIDAGLDTGDILRQRETDIGEEETAPELAARLAVMGAELLVETLDEAEQGLIQPQRQNHEEATYAPILKKEDGRIDWSLPARTIYNRIRGFLPWPGAYTTFRGQVLHIWRARVTGERLPYAPGTACTGSNRLLVACGDNTAIECLELQLEGRKKMPASAFLNGQRLVELENLGP
ncbi:MAG: methionyl-tRNA formyltransferase [Bryobacteraceae bacterium]|nr:methionyl-tRNA formyltransferase [Bryobacteraceae bacterium]MDW8377986.1 methionyl-tRNA formyltransferase [Bryobacterales bacterium]